MVVDQKGAELLVARAIQPGDLNATNSAKIMQAAKQLDELDVSMQHKDIISMM